MNLENYLVFTTVESLSTSKLEKNNLRWGWQQDKGWNGKALFTIQRSFYVALRCVSKWGSWDLCENFCFVCFSNDNCINNNNIGGIVVKTHSRSSGWPFASQFQWPDLSLLLNWHQARDVPIRGQRRSHLNKESTPAEIKWWGDQVSTWDRVVSLTK